MSDDIADLVIDDIRDRKKVGMRNYGHALKANNGRNALRDLYEELLDAAQYCKQELIERAALRDELARVRQDYDMATVEIDGYKKAAALMNKGMEASENGRMEWKLKARDLESQLAASVAERDAMRVRYEEAVEALRMTISGRCYACGWTFAKDDKGCAPGNCSFRPPQESPEHGKWIRRQRFIYEILSAHDSRLPEPKEPPCPQN